MSDHKKILIIGTGSLSQNIVLSIASMAAVDGRPIEVTVAGRSSDRAQQISAIANSRSAILGIESSFISKVIDWESQNSLDELFGDTFDVIVNTASYQSMGTLSTNSKWSELIAEAGYGLTIALQAALIPRILRSIKNKGDVPPVFVNACYCDVVNYAYKCIGEEITSGLGNVSLIAEAVKLQSEYLSRQDIAVYSGHYNVNALINSRDLKRNEAPLIYLNGKKHHPRRLDMMPSQEHINVFNGALSASFILTLCCPESSSIHHVSGPNGMLGGYPCNVKCGVIEPIFPEAVDHESIKKWQHEMSIADGVHVDESGYVNFPNKSGKLLERISPDLAKGFSFSDVQEVSIEFLRLRDSLI